MGLLKWNKEFALEQAADDAELLQELIEIFKTSFDSDVQLIKEGITGNDPELISSAAHSIKGAASSLGIDGVTEVVREIENDSKDGSVGKAKELLTSLDNLLAEVNGL